MKGIDILCASPASIAICSSVDHHNATRQNDHYHYLHDSQKNQSRVPCLSELPIVPKQYSEKRRKSSAKRSDSLRKSSADITDLTSPPGYSSRYLLSDSSSVECLDNSKRGSVLVRSQSAKTSGSFSALVRAHSTKSRQMNSVDSSRFKAKPTEPYATLVCEQSANKTRQLDSNDTKATKTSEPFRELIQAKAKSRQLSSIVSQPVLKSSSSARSREQVVALRVSIHCKGCEKKIRKHISKIEGVTSFSIDFESKKVMIKGDVTPLGVLASMSKVKNAQLW